MQIAKSAILKPGVTLANLPGPRAGDEARAGAAHLVRGTALIFWDPKTPGKKLDAIDTDQITPAADCVSESLDTLDERWKAGAFRYLMPDFRARVHGGQTFVIAGDRLAMRELEVGERLGDRIEIASGVKEGERVAITDVDTLEDGALVTVKR